MTMTPYGDVDIYSPFPGETDARYIARMDRVIAGFNARQLEGKWSEGRERNRAQCINGRDVARLRLQLES
jgi:hypothetical protein